MSNTSNSTQSAPVGKAKELNIADCLFGGQVKVKVSKKLKASRQKVVAVSSKETDKESPATVISELPSAALAGSDPSRRPMVTIEWVEEMEAYPPMNGQSTPSQPRWRSWAAEAEDSRAFWGGRSPVSTPIIEPAAYGEAGDESTNEPMVDVHGDEPEQVTEEEEDISGMEQWDHPAYACFRHLLPAMEELDRREEEEEVAKRAKECVDRQWEWAKDKVDLWERLIDSRGVREKSEVRRMVRVEGVSESEAWVRTVRDRDPQYLRLEHPRWSRTPAELGVRPLQVVWSKSRGVAA